ncbi:S-adenosylmethionine synthetase [Nocardiopsis arvandica]|uniref:S-adenosylmethionine synthetase n=1 Tax=Nocardiopsis sinuspersici TaxID=501010 RepID=A0A7Y9XDY8_9ACTN|nr:methionine adenosyltransferase [Nocardiopsis sinuspersici]NYH54037.1 S-adenosylmethionine synthetase [Nocardiopsis sinuspersici]
MRITCHEALVSSTDFGFNVVERKGIGHPDSLADLIAEEFSRRYSLHGLDRFGAVPNHWVDKVALVGAEAEVTFGRYAVHKPISAYLFGKVTRSVGGQSLPIEGLFRAAVEDVLAEATGSDDIVCSVRSFVENTAGVGADHPVSFYLPSAGEECRVPGGGALANDTAFCSAYAPADPLDVLAIDVENHVNGSSFKDGLDGLGSDVKVMLVRSGSVLEVTVCLPVYPEAVGSHREYTALVSEAYGRLDAFVNEHPVVRRRPWLTRLSVNTKDHGRNAYLAPFGTSLGKGDCGLVGRGNKANGVISASGGAGVEALAGKNPMHHTGKLYTLAAARLADRIHAKLGVPNEVVLVSRNGDRLDDPSFVGVQLAPRDSRLERDAVEELTAATLAELPLLSERLLALSPIDRFRDPSLVLEV